MRNVKTDFDTLMTGIAGLREQRAKLESERMAIGAQIRAISETPPNRDELKTVMRRVIEGFENIWNQKLIKSIALFKETNQPDDFIARHVPLAFNDQFIRENGWYALLGHGMKQGIDPFVDQLDWPDGLSNTEREKQLAALNADLDAISAKVAALDEQFSYTGIAIKNPKKTELT